MMRCRLFGHDFGFAAEGSTMSWRCERCGEPGGMKTYASAADARAYAAAFNRRDSDDTGRRAPFLGMFPLRIWNRLRRRRQ